MIQQPLALALVGVIGTGIGVIAALLPIELLGKRDLHERVAKIWRLLDLEIARLVAKCQEFHGVLGRTEKALSELSGSDTSVPLIGMAHLPSHARQVAVSSGDFVAQAPDDLLLELNDAYDSLDLTNAQMDRYLSYSSVATGLVFFNNDAGLELLRANIAVHYESLENASATLLSRLLPLQEKISDQEKVHDAKAKRLSRMISALWMSAVLIFLVAFILMIIFFFLQAAPSPQPLATPTPTST